MTNKFHEQILGQINAMGQMGQNAAAGAPVAPAANDKSAIEELRQCILELDKRLNRLASAICIFRAKLEQSTGAPVVPQQTLLPNRKYSGKYCATSKCCNCEEEGRKWRAEILSDDTIRFQGKIYIEIVKVEIVKDTK